MGNANLTGQYARWSMILQEYDFTVHHRAGKRHQNADHLSRAPLESTRDSSGARLNREDDPLVPPPQFVDEPPPGRKGGYPRTWPGVHPAGGDMRPVVALAAAARQRWERVEASLVEEDGCSVGGFIPAPASLLAGNTGSVCDARLAATDVYVAGHIAGELAASAATHRRLQRQRSSGAGAGTVSSSRARDCACWRQRRMAGLGVVASTHAWSLLAASCQHRGGRG